MRFRITSITSEPAGSRLNAVTTRMEDWLNAALRDASFGPGVNQLTLVVVAVDDDPAVNLSFGADRLETLHPLGNGQPFRSLRLSLSIAPSQVLAMTVHDLFGKLAQVAIEKLSVRPKRLPKDFEYSRCVAAVEAALIEPAL